MEGEGERKDNEKHFEGKETKEKSTHDVKKKDGKNKWKQKREGYIFSKYVIGIHSRSKPTVNIFLKIHVLPTITCYPFH